MLFRLALALFLAVGLFADEHRVDPRNTYQRVICVVPLTGSGTPADPKRPQYAPSTPDPEGIMAFYFQPTDDGKFAVVEFVARNRNAFRALFADKSITLFEKGRSPKTDIETAIRHVRKDFD